MTETNHASEAAASSPSPYLSEGMLRAQANPDCAFPDAVQVLATEVLRMRAQCPPTAEVEKLRHAAREENRLHGHLSNIGSALSEAGHPPTRTRGDELERIRDLAGERDAWKHKADTLGGDLNRIRSLVTPWSEDQTTFDAVKTELQRLRAELTPLREAVALMATAKPDMQVDANDPVGMARQVVELVERLRQDGLTALNAAYGQRKRAEEAEARAKSNAKMVTERSDRIRHLHDDLATIRAALVRCGRAVGGKMADDVSLEFLGYIPAEVERVVERMRAEAKRVDDRVQRLAKVVQCHVGDDVYDAAEKKLGELRAQIATGEVAGEPGASLTEEAQTAIAAMRDVGPELAKAGLQVGPRLSHAEAVAQLRGERDRWREKFEEADKESGATARRILAMCDRLAGAGFDWTGAESNAAGLHNAVNAALAEMARLRKESKRDQVGKQQALLDEIARLLPGKGPLLERVRAAAKVVEQDVIAERVCRELDLDPEKLWLEAMRRTEPKRDVALAPIRGLVDEAVRSLFERRSCKEPKVGPATGQPRNEVPLAADGSGTVVELGEAFRQNLSNAVACLPEGAIDPTTTKIAIRNLHACVAELAKVVERIGVRS